MTLKASADQVQTLLREKGFDFIVKELPASTRSAKDAAQAIGCSVKEIAKSIVLRTVKHQQPLLVIASGVNQINLSLVENVMGEPLELPDGKWVKNNLGFAIGGIPPIGYTINLPVFIDHDLLAVSTLWAAAGTPNAVFSLPSSELVKLNPI